MFVAVITSETSPSFNLKAASFTSAGIVVVVESNLTLPPSSFVSESVDLSSANLEKSSPSSADFFTSFASSSLDNLMICASTSGWKDSQAVFRSSSVIST